MFRKKPVVDGHHDGLRADGVGAGDGVVGVQTAERPAATVVVDNHGQVVANDRRPVDADRNVGEPVVANGPFLDP
ncbi:Uncharacterised protein [Mycobacterium tuberculosis]|uniref:Uncharacterized protein n=1 Tax=Mycobacterium tuberculosis TaxID=1773 RepID=A0A654TBV6_MYCTX|nr:Uncharacterised protein [Mycobacterium tuberculosis]